MVSFGGWEMPLSYPGGTISEHMACRQSAAVFDVSHLGTVRISGPGSFELLQAQLSNDLRRIGPGRAQYSQLLDADDASVLDDLIVWWLSDDVFDVMPNASNTDRVLDAIGGTDVTGTRAVIALQGPRARSILSGVFPDAARVQHFHVAELTWQSLPVTVAGTGYTGEDGVELSIGSGSAHELWTALIGAGAVPAGLGARDTLRLEAGLPLHGHELGPGISPLQAGLGWSVGWDKPSFRGSDPLRAERRAGPRRILRGIVAEGRQPLRDHAQVIAGGREIGTVTSGNFSPVLGRGIALALVDTSAQPDLGDAVEVQIRGRRVGAHVASLPFVKPGSTSMAETA
jgi:aminomethyltransferase